MSSKKRSSPINSSSSAEPEKKTKFKLLRALNCNTNTVIKRITIHL